MPSLPVPLPGYSQGQEFEVSVYQNGTLTPEVLVREMRRLRDAFPALPQPFFELLAQRVRDKRFSNSRFTDAVNHIIDTCQYPQPMLASILGYDRRVKLYTHQQVLTMVSNGYRWDDFAKVRMNGQLYRMLRAEKELYNIPDEF